MTSDPGRDSQSIREELRHLLSISGTMAGLCIMSATLVATLGKTSGAGSVADEMLVVCALLFLLCTYAVFWALRARQPEVVERLDRTAEILFAVAMTGMVSAGFVMLYTFW